MEGKWMGNRSPKRSIVALMRFAQSSQFETLHDNAALAVSKAPRGNSHVVELGKGWGLTQRSLTSLRRPWPRSRSRRRRPGPWSCQSRRRCRPCRSRRPWRPAARTRLRQGRGGALRLRVTMLGNEMLLAAARVVLSRQYWRPMPPPPPVTMITRPPNSWSVIMREAAGYVPLTTGAASWRTQRAAPAGWDARRRPRPRRSKATPESI